MVFLLTLFSGAGLLAQPVNDNPTGAIAITPNPMGTRL